MQDRYAGDVGDFGKFSLLKALFNHPKYRLGIIWYLYPNESHNDDGRHIEYLDKTEYKNCDVKLVRQLAHIVSDKRSVKSLEKLNVLSSNVVYYSVPLICYEDNPGQTALAKQTRKESREKWLVDAVKMTSDCNVVFLDPDNGLEIKSVPGINQKKSGKFSYYSEVEALFYNKSACVIYHHLNRSQSHDKQIKHRVEYLSSMINNDDVVFALRYKPYSPRAYFILTKQSEVEFMRKNIQGFMASSCGYGWDSYYER